MRRRDYSDLERLQQSVQYLAYDESVDRPNASKPSRYIYSLYPYMLIQDLHTGIMPIGGRTIKIQFDILLAPPSPKTEKIINHALSPSNYYRDLSGTVCNFISDCAVKLLIYEKASYEIVYLRNQKSKIIEGFELLHIDPLTLKKRGNRLLQVIPREIAIKLNKSQKIELNPENILEFSIPSHYQGSIGKMMEYLGVLSRPTAPEFYMQELATGLRKSQYNAKLHIYTHNLALAEVTKNIGWNARQLFQNEALEFYLIHRFLSFEDFKIELRDNILKQLNEGFKRAGKTVGFEGQITMIGLPSTDNIKTARSRLKAGTATFNEILESFKVY